MGISNAKDVVHGLENCPRLLEFLEKDLKSDTEVGFAFGESGTVYEFREGDWDQVTFTLPPSNEDAYDHLPNKSVDSHEKRVIVHTHPSIDAVGSGGVTVSESDVEVGEHPAVCGMIVASREMFDVNWKGTAMFFGEDGTSETVEFEIECDGTTDGPARDRWVENPRFSFE